MMLAIVSVLILLLGNIVQSVFHSRAKKKLSDENINLKREKFDREIKDAKKKIRDDIDAIPLDELVRRK